MKKIILLLAATVSVSVSYAQQVKAVKIKPEKKISIQVPEPSDVCLSPVTNTFFIVGDGGFLFETDTQGTIIRKANFSGLDCEGVFADDQFVYVAEEFSRKIRIFDLKTLELVRTINVPYSGGRNKAYEAITYNKAKGKFILFTEKSPIYLFELDSDFKTVNEIELTGIARDVSAATYYNDFLWILSDEDMTVFKLDPNSYKVLAKWKLPVLNPEGLTFDKDGNMVVLSDDLQKIYYFQNPERP